MTGNDEFGFPTDIPGLSPSPEVPKVEEAEAKKDEQEAAPAEADPVPDFGSIQMPEGEAPASVQAEEILNEIPGVFDEPPADPAANADRAEAEAILADAPQAPSESTTAAAPSEGATALNKIKEYSDNVSIAQAVVPAAYPYSLLITGRLTEHEKEKLLDVLSRENMGIREVDLDPQLEAGKILIPRISEFAGVLLVQALRGSSARMKLGPSDSIFAAEDSRGDQLLPITGAHEDVAWTSADAAHPAESLPVTSEPTIPNLPHFSVMDTLTATSALRSDVVETESSPEYQEALDALQRELKYKAHRRGAQAIVSFSIQLTALSLPSHYRITVTGLAIRASSGESGKTSSRTTELSWN